MSGEETGPPEKISCDFLESGCKTVCSDTGSDVQWLAKEFVSCMLLKKEKKKKQCWGGSSQCQKNTENLKKKQKQTQIQL